MKEFKKDKLTVKVMATRTEMGQVAAQDIHDRILALLKEKDEINMIFAAAPSQNDVLKSLTEFADIPWNRINACHMDEYIGLDKSAPHPRQLPEKAAEVQRTADYGKPGPNPHRPNPRPRSRRLL